MPVNFSPAEPADRAVRWLVPNYHPKLGQLGVEIRCAFRDDLPQSAGRDVPYTVHKISSRAAFLAHGGLDRKPEEATAAETEADAEKCQDCGGPLTQAVAGADTDYPGEVIRFCEREGCTRWLDHILVPREEEAEDDAEGTLEYHGAGRDAFEEMPLSAEAEEGAEREVTDTEEFGSESERHPAPARQPDPSASFFLLEFSLPYWEGLTDFERLAMVDEALCQCHAGRGEKTGALVLQKRKGVTIYPENLRRFGLWNENAEVVSGALEPNPQVALPFEEIGSLDARVSPQQAAEVLSGPRPVLEIVGMGTMEPGDLDAQDGELRQVLIPATEAGTAEDIAQHEINRAFQDFAEDPEPVRTAPTLTVEQGGAPPKSRKKAPEEVVTPDSTGWREHVDARRGAEAEPVAAAAGS